jgi:hypothetical protein
MSRDVDKSFKREYNTKTRGDFIDYDYDDKLSEEDRKYLAKFTDEFYGAAFDISPTFIKYTDCIKKLKKIVKSEKIEVKRKKFEKQLKLLKKTKDQDFVQISGNSDRSKNIDLRKFRDTDKYYQSSTGELICDVELKYTDENVHNTPETRALCNQYVNSNQRDVMSKGHRHVYANEQGIDVYIENYNAPALSPLDQLILEEEIDEKLNSD